MLKKMIAGMALVSLMTVSAEACTVMVVTKGASADGSTMVSHSNDGRGAEMNLIYVPAKDHPKGSKRPVYPTAVALNTMPEYNAFDQPNLVAPERSEGYDYPGKPRTVPIAGSAVQKRRRHFLFSRTEPRRAGTVQNRPRGHSAYGQPDR